MGNKRERHSRYPGVYVMQSKRSRHQGRPDQTFYITYKDGGRKVWKKVGRLSDGITAQYASDELSKIKREVRSGGMSPTKLTLAQAWEHYDNSLSGKPSQEGARKMYHLYIGPVLGGRFLGSLVVDDVMSLEHELHRTVDGRSRRKNVRAVGDSTLSRNYVRGIVGLLGRIIRYSVRMGYFFGNNPVDRVHIRKADDNRVRIANEEEVLRLLSYFREHNPLMFDICVIALNTGLRRAAITKLKCGDVDFHHAIIYALDGKNGKTLAVPVNSDCREVLLRRAKGKAGMPVFVGDEGKCVSPEYVTRRFRAAVKALGLNAGHTESRHKFVFHTLRHTFASWLVNDGVALQVVSDLLGHSSIEMTKRYAKLDQSTKAEAASRISGKMHRARGAGGVTPLQVAM